MKNVTEFPASSANPAVDAAVRAEQANIAAMQARDEQIRQAMANAEITPVTICGYLKTKDPDGSTPVVKSSFEVPLPRNAGPREFEAAGKIVLKQFSDYRGIDFQDPKNPRLLHFYHIDQFEKMTVEFGQVSGITLA